MGAKFIFAFSCSLFGSQLSLASYFFTPIGHHEAFMGNSGTAMPCSSGSAIYNAAGLGFCENFVNLSVSGTSIAYQETESKVFAQEAGSLKSSTLLTSAIFSVNEKTHMGFYYSYPTNTQDYFRVVSTDSLLTEELIRQAALAGISYGGLWLPNLSWGFSIGITWNELNSASNYSVTNGSNGTLRASKRIQEEDYVILNPSILWRVSDSYDLALTLQWRALNIYSEGNLYQTELSTGQTSAIESFDRYTPHTAPILGFTLGQAFHLNAHLLLVDLSYAPQFALAATPDRVSDNLKLFNVSTGIKGTLVQNASYMAGLSYSSVDQEDVYLATAGLSILRKSLEANFGLYYQYNSNRNVGAINSDILGFLYSSSINY